MAEQSKRAKIFKTLSAVDVAPLIQKKNELDYLSWANAWAVLMEYYPDSDYEIQEFDEIKLNQNSGEWQKTGRKVDYLKTEAGVEVRTKVIIEGETYSQRLYVMDFRNKAIKEPTLFEINKAQQRCLVKAIAMAGLGLNLYQGEDLPTEATFKQKGISKEQQEERQQLNVKKAAYFSLLTQVSKATGKSPDNLKKLAGERVNSEYAGTKLSMLETYEYGIKALQDILAESKGA